MKYLILLTLLLVGCADGDTISQKTRSCPLCEKMATLESFTAHTATYHCPDHAVVVYRIDGSLMEASELPAYKKKQLAAEKAE